MPPIEAVLIGAGQRGRDAAGAFALRRPNDLKFVAVAEPRDDRRARFARDHGIPPERQFRSYEDLFAKPRLAPLCFNLTMDRMHLPSPIAALEAGYHLFLEKPMADTPEGCLAIADAARRCDRMVQVCHPLRFTAFYKKVKEFLAAGAIGDPLTFSMVENVAYWHFGHSFVRGNWGKLENSGPLILTKCCHDMDIASWLADSPVRKVSSFGSLSLFRPENAPAGAPRRCTDGCPVEATCPFFAPKQYLTDYTDWPVSVISLDPSPEARRRALETGPYGLCIFKTGNDVVDHQVVDANFESGAVLSFSVEANSVFPYRSIRIIGTEGELNGHFEKPEITVLRQKQGFWVKSEPERCVPEALEGAHSGGDTGAILNFLRCFRDNDRESIRHSLDIAVEGHLLAFAAEEARRTESVVDIKTYKSQVRAGR